MTQWAVDSRGKSRDIFASLKNAAKRRVKLGILYNNHNNDALEHGWSPSDLKSYQIMSNQIKVGTPSISGLIHPDRVGNIIHSKLMVADK
jgi:phosphatidylserine/phosphatidylglycerophosphate/cardiolipin synthase-like enzyme